MTNTMEFKTKTLLAAADHAKKIVSSSTSSTIKQVPILSTILLEASLSAGNIRLTATDLINTYQNTLKCLPKPKNVVSTEAGAWSACVDAGAFTKILKAVKQDTVNLILSTNNELNIITTKTTYKLPTMQADKFPQVLKDVGPWLPVTSINSEDLKKLELAASSYDTNNILSAINYNPCGRFTAVDGNILIIFNGEKSDRYDSELNMSSGIVKFLPAKTDFYIWTDKNLTRLSNGDEHFYTKNLEGQFPRYMQLIPQHNDDVMSISSKDLADALKEVEITLNPKTSIVRFNFDKDNQSIYLISDTPEVGETKTRIKTINTNINGLKYDEIAFNHTYLKTFNKLGERINFIMDPASNLKCVKLTFNNKYTGLIMPIRIRK